MQNIKTTSTKLHLNQSDLDVHKRVKNMTLDEMIPVKPAEGCPSDTYGCEGISCYDKINCFCEPHCSWKKCRLFQKPNACLSSVDSEWRWSSQKMCWVAQIKGMKRFHCISYIMVSKRNSNMIGPSVAISFSLQGIIGSDDTSNFTAVLKDYPKITTNTPKGKMDRDEQEPQESKPFSEWRVILFQYFYVK